MPHTEETLSLDEINAICLYDWGMGIADASGWMALRVVEDILAESGVVVFGQVQSHRRSVGKDTPWPITGSALYDAMGE